MKFKDIKDLSVDELKKKKATLTQDIMNAKLKNSLGQLSNPMDIRFNRKDLARVNTALATKTAR